MVSAWPIRALIERQRLPAAKRAIGPVLAMIPKVERVGSRAEGLDILWHAVFPGGGKFRQLILSTLESACAPDAHWRAKRLYVDIVSTLATDDVATAELVLARMPPGATKRKAGKVLAKGRVRAPRPFFWAAA